jgi:hypothetical protein
MVQKVDAEQFRGLSSVPGDANVVSRGFGISGWMETAM